MVSEAALQTWELASYVVTVLGFPLALLAIWREMRAERENERKELEQREDEIYVELSQQYSGILEKVLAHPELDLLETGTEGPLSELEHRRRTVYYEMLLSLFERAFILLYEPEAGTAGGRRWASWADFIRWWLRRPDFAAWVRENLEGEDPEFAAWVRGELEGRG